MASNRSKVTGFRGGRDPAALQENMELLTGQRGNGLDRAITVRELAQLGLISVTRNTQGSVITTPALPTLPEDKPIERPHAPVGFAGFGGFGAIMLEWQNPTFYGFAHAEIWRAVPNADGSAPNIDQAVLIATTPATVFGDVVEPGSAFYYWCRFINTKNIPGPYQGVDGIRVSTSSSIENIIDEIGTQMKDSELITTLSSNISNISSSVTEQRQTLDSINENGSKAYQTMWSIKTQTEEITAGIGLLSKSDGTSQVAIAASQFFVFDPNVAGGETQPLFAIDGGKVVIPKALIETATIQILTAQRIVADEVKAGISIESPEINGGKITGGWAGFGPGGRFNGYHTYISANGVLQSDQIQAYGGSFDNVRILNNCVIEGTLSVAQIKGDVYKRINIYKANGYRFNTNTGTSNDWHNALEFVLDPEDIDKSLDIPEIDIDYGGAYIDCRLYIEDGVSNRYQDLNEKSSRDVADISKVTVVNFPARRRSRCVLQIRGWNQNGNSSGVGMAPQTIKMHYYKSVTINV
ncbi:TPA: phage tail tip fiber protein [Photobacterium damselae]